MSLQTSRFESQQIVNNFNIFVDTEKANLLGHAQSKGDDVQIHLEGNSIEAQDGEIIRLSLTNFTMFNNIYNVNIHNSKFRVRSAGTGASRNELLLIKHQNYKNLADIATNFASVLQAELVAAASANSGNSTVSSTVITPTGTDDSMSSTSDRLFSVVYTFGGAHAISSLVIQTNENDGDCYAIMGALRLDNDAGNADTTFNSFEVTIASTTITVKGFFPMQRMTDPYVYIRCGSVNNGLEMSTLSRSVAGSGFNTDILNSDILAKVFRDVEFINFHSSTDEYFINLQQRRLSTLRFFLTDKNGNPLGRLISEPGNGTASGRTANSDNTGVPNSKLQSTLGNLYFTAVIKCEIIKVRNPKKLESDPPVKPLPARVAQAPLVWEDYGNPKY
jgi:hypothetical protein